MGSLKDQLLKAGLVNKEKAKKTPNRPPKKKAPTKAKKDRQPIGGPSKLTESNKRAQRAMLEKARKDKALNERRQKEAAAKAKRAEIMQLVTQSKLERKEGETAYNFTFRKKVKTIYVTAEQQKQLSRDQIAIISVGSDSFEIVPKAAAQKIAERDANYVIQNNSSAHGKPSVADKEDDPYADYQIPDDLTW